ncbi:MAG: amidophosphoribosyltransferase [Coriobacteriales bacterium]|nr:amidophosphoribosyltransferase [Coriobacteriales bacterium]
MGAFFGAASKRDVALDVFFGVDYHSHLGTKRAGMVVWDPQEGFQRQIHSIENTPFRTKFEEDLNKFKGCSAIGCISDSDPQPLLVRSHLGVYALSTVGAIGNTEKLVEKFSDAGMQFMALSSGGVNATELVAALINTQPDIVSGILYAQEQIEGSLTLLIMTAQGELIAARDRMGRLPVLIGKDDGGYCVTFESFAYGKLGYVSAYELGSGEIVRITAEGFETLSPARDEMRICAFLWVYYGYPNSNYEGVNVEVMRYRNGAIMARDEAERGLVPDVDYVAGVPDSGLPHGIGYATQSGRPFARPFVKYTPTWPRSFMPANQEVRNRVAKMKQIPVPELIAGKKLLFVDDSIVRGTQLRETVDFLYGAGAAEVHMRSACPPIMYGCKYLSFSRSNSDYELIARRKIKELEGTEGEDHIEEYADSRTERGTCMLKAICSEMGFDSLNYQTLDGMLEAIGIDRKKICTYCWNGKQ